MPIPLVIIYLTTRQDRQAGREWRPRIPRQVPTRKTSCNRFVRLWRRPSRCSHASAHSRIRPGILAAECSFPIPTKGPQSAIVLGLVTPLAMRYRRAHGGSRRRFFRRRGAGRGRRRDLVAAQAAPADTPHDYRSLYARARGRADAAIPVTSAPGGRNARPRAGGCG